MQVSAYPSASCLRITDLNHCATSTRFSISNGMAATKPKNSPSHMSLFRLVQTMALTILIASSAAYRRNDASRKGPKSSPLAAAKSIVGMWSRTLSAILTSAAKESASIFRIICPR